MLLFIGAAFFGAPYVPTRKKDVENAIALLDKDDVLVDLGSGDGRLVRAAAKRGVVSYGIELSPLLALFSWLYTLPLRSRAHIRFGNYWKMHLPDTTTVIFVFLASTHMAHLKKYLEHEATRLGRPLTLISYAFELPGYKPKQTVKALMVYTIAPTKP